MKPRFRGSAAVFLALALAFSTALIGAAAKAAPYAALVMDARTGEVLHARSADRKLHPASLTKMMTLYLAIEAVKDGRLELDQKVTVSANASRQPPSKVGLRRGQKVTIRHLMRAAAVKSANDAAVALAEATHGSVAAWAVAATAKARVLGMPNTTFKNPHGLTQSGHLSTARDMAVLGRRLFFDHPEYYGLFKRKRTVAMGRTLNATNRRLLSQYKGADGIKTGYTRAAGFNLVASAQRDGKHVIASMFGGRSVASRTKRVMELLDMGFARSPRHAAVIPPAPVQVEMARAPMPSLRPAPPKLFLDRVADALAPAAAAAERRPTTASRWAPAIAEVPPLRPWGEARVMAKEFPALRSSPGVEVPPARP